MTLYSKAILIHGVAIPGAMIGISFLGVLMGLNKISSQRTSQEDLKIRHEDLTSQMQLVQSNLELRRGKMAAWDQRLEGEVLQKITRRLQEIMVQYNERELRQTALGRPADRSMLAGYTENNYSRFQLTFEGGFGPMQQVLAELELIFPQIVLERMTVLPGRENEYLEFNATYVCWNEPLTTMEP